MYTILPVKKYHHQPIQLNYTNYKFYINDSFYAGAQQDILKSIIHIQLQTAVLPTGRVDEHQVHTKSTYLKIYSSNSLVVTELANKYQPF